MNGFVESFAFWLADFYLLSTLLLAAALAAMSFIKQPVQRLAIARAVVVALVLLAALCAVPRWSVVHLLARSGDAPRSAPAAVADVRRDVAQRAVREAKPQAVGLVPGEARVVVGGALAVGSASLRDVSWSMLVTVVQAVGGALVLGWLVWGWIAARRLLSKARLAPEELSRLLGEFIAPPERKVSLQVSDALDVAVALGVLRPAVLLPSAWIELRSAEELRTVLAHEAAHVVRGDLRWLAVSRSLLVLLWAQPLYWLLRRRMGLDQEALADAAAAAEIGGRTNYAEQLVSWAKAIPAQRRMALSTAVGLWEGPSQLRKRIAMLLDERLSVLRTCSIYWRSAVACLAVVIAVGLSLVTLTGEGSANKKPSATERILRALAAYPPIDAPVGDLPIEGRCVDENGRGLAGVTVALIYKDFERHTFGLVEQTTTNDRGSYKFVHAAKSAGPRELGRDMYWIVAWSPGRATIKGNFYPSQTPTRNFTMPAAASVTGRVTDEAGNPIAGALVRFEHHLTQPIEGLLNAKTDADGMFAVQDLRAMPSNRGSNWVLHQSFQVEHPGFATADVSYEHVPSRVDVVLRPQAVITGRVVYDLSHRPVEGVRVELRGVEDGNANHDDDATREAVAETDSKGRYRFEGLRAGMYDIRANAPNWTSLPIDSVEVVYGEERETPAISLMEGGFLAGRLVDVDSGKPLPVGDDYYTVVVMRSKRDIGGSPLGRVRVDADGKFKLRLPPGRHYAFASGIQSPTGPNYEPKRELVTIRDGETTEMDLAALSNEELREKSSLEPSATGEFGAGSAPGAAVGEF